MSDTASDRARIGADFPAIRPVADRGMEVAMRAPPESAKPTGSETRKRTTGIIMATSAIDLLKEDHRNIKKHLEELSETSNRATKRRTELLSLIQQELKIHTTIEEEIFYPAYKDSGEKEDVVRFYEATEEHRAVEALVLPDLDGTDPGSDKFLGRAKVLKDLIEHHVQEEENEMFKRASKLMSKDDLESLGQRMQERKTALTKSA
jgi:hemerythrin-like domain-containing protein